MKILSFDIEEWYIEKAFHGNRTEQISAFNSYLDDILNILDAQQLKATFFVVGMMAVEFPQIVKKIHSRGHEIGCHSHQHLWLNKMSPKEVLLDTRNAIDALEQCIGEPVKSYRAPAFSIGESNTWAFDILAECGIERDSSVFPTVRDFGGFPSFGSCEPTVIDTLSGAIKEFPIATIRLLGREVAYSGGGYFRFFPLHIIQKQLDANEYSICYFHIADLMPAIGKLQSRQDYEEYYKEPGTLWNRCKRYLKENIGKKSAFNKLKEIVLAHEFVSLSQASLLIDWGAVPHKTMNMR